ncbi:MAG: PAS domain S-box protein [Syntrophales bacterium]
MKDKGKTSGHAIAELSHLRNRVAELERDLLESLTEKDALETREMHFRRLVENTSDVIFEVDHQGVIIYFSPIGKEIWGYDQDDIIGKNYIEFVHPDDRDNLLKRFVELSTGVEKQLAYRIKNKAGQFRWIRTKTKPRIENGKFVGAVGILIDVSDQKQFEGALRESEKKYRALIETTGTGFVIIDGDGLVQDANKEYIRLAGRRNLREIIGRSVQEWTAVHEKEKNAAAVRECFKKGYLRNLEIDYVDSLGNITPIEINATRMESEGAPPQILTLCRDITDRKRAEDALRRKNIELDALNQLARSVTSKTDLEEACRAAVREVSQTLGPDAVVLFVREGDELHLLASGPDEKIHPVETTPTHRVGECLCGLAVGANKPIYVARIADDERCTWMECRNAGLNSFAAIPMRLGGHSIGLLGVASSSERDFRQDARYLETAADQLAMIIHNARLLDETRAYTAQLQQAIAERDITQYSLKDRELQLTVANLMLQNVLQTIPVRVFWKDRDSRYLGCNNLFAHDVGLKNPEDVVGKDDYDLGPCLPVECYRSDDKLVMDSGQARIGYEEHQVTPDGDLSVLRTSKVPLRNDTGEIIGILGTYEDITERKRTEEALKDSETMLRSVFKAVPIAVTVLSAARIIINVNDFTFEVFGYPRDEMIGRNSRFLYFSDEEYKQAGAALYINMLATKASTIEVRMRRKDGAEIWVVLSASPLQAEGVAAGAVVAAMDITARKALEGQLRQSQKMEAIGQLAGGVAHDFNNMLQAILGYTSIVLHTLSPGDKNLPKLLEVRKAGERAALLTQQLLAFSRRQLLQLAPLDLNQSIEDLMKMLQRLIGEDIDLIVLPGRELWAVNADRGQIEQVVMNVCLNARDSMPEGGRLSIETNNKLFDAPYCVHNEWAKPGHYVKLSITDSGCGMDEETKGKIFEPFFTTKDPDKGTGLGLATVYGIVRQHNGMIQVYSEPGKGSRFSIYLPAIEQTETIVPSEFEEPVPDGQETILLAEDNEQIRRLALDILESSGYEVLAAVDGEDALRVYHDYTGKIDLLLLDVVMPKKGGRSVYDKICSLRPDIGCLFISGYSANAVHTNFILDQGLHLIQKPFKNDDLLRAVRKALDHSQ